VKEGPLVGFIRPPGEEEPPIAVDRSVLAWLESHHDALVQDLADLVAIPSISTDGQHQEDWKVLMRSIVHLFDKLGNLPGDKVK
jgi:hypothetical protein